MVRNVKRKRVEKKPCVVQNETPFLEQRNRPVSIEDFKTFFCCKSYDVISEGRFRRHMMYCREINDNWATNAQRCVTEVGSRIRFVQEKVKELDSTPCLPIRHVCELVTAMPLPPLPKDSICGECVISKIKSNNNMVIQKRKNDTDKMIVNNHYSHFLICLWVANKIEYIVRNYTRCKFRPHLSTPRSSLTLWCFQGGWKHRTATKT